MKILVHDYAGHPFQVHLSRHLASRGHDVTHVYFADDHGPKGTFARPGDPPSLRFIGITLGRVVAQTKLVARRFDQMKYGRRMAGLIQSLAPDAVISGNTPTETQRAIIDACKRGHIRFVYWLQDVYSIAVTKIVTKQFGYLGRLIGSYYRRLDREQYRDSDAIVVTTEDFVALAASWSGDAGKITVIENWAALDDIPMGQKDNAWSRAHGLDKEFNFLYSGTLGRKHSPALLLRLAQESGAQVAVVGQGLGMKYLEAVRKPDALRLLPLQPHEAIADVLATADVLVATLEIDAAAFAVPSKILSYLCAGRPILLSAPKENLAARTVLRANAGIVVDPGDEAGFLAAAAQLRADPHMRAIMGASGRAYADRTFDLSSITDKFEMVFTDKNERHQPLRTG
jgi:colanic acid biosynthesis glycosyl transferase WcaI